MVPGELPVLEIMRDVSLPTVANPDFAETLYAEYLRNPSAVPAEWRAYFATLSNGDRRPKPESRPVAHSGSN